METVKEAIVKEGRVSSGLLTSHKRLFYVLCVPFLRSPYHWGISKCRRECQLRLLHRSIRTPGRKEEEKEGKQVSERGKRGRKVGSVAILYKTMHQLFRRTFTRSQHTKKAYNCCWLGVHELFFIFFLPRKPLVLNNTLRAMGRMLYLCAGHSFVACGRMKNPFGKI